MTEEEAQKKLDALQVGEEVEIYAAASLCRSAKPMKVALRDLSGGRRMLVASSIQPDVRGNIPYVPPSKLFGATVYDRGWAFTLEAAFAKAEASLTDRRKLLQQQLDRVVDKQSKLQGMKAKVVGGTAK